MQVQQHCSNWQLCRKNQLIQNVVSWYEVNILRHITFCKMGSILIQAYNWKTLWHIKSVPSHNNHTIDELSVVQMKQKNWNKTKI